MAAVAGPDSSEELAYTPLHDLHLELGAKMVPFAGYDMPVQYPMGVLAEHTHTRDKAGLFDVSHMGQAVVVAASHEAAARALEALVPADILGLGRGRQRYTQLLNEDGGIIDDLMITRPEGDGDDGRLLLVVNAARKDVDYAYLKEKLPADVGLELQESKALLALQGPTAAEVLGQWCPEAADLSFMGAAQMQFDRVDCHVSRSGYTGEDGFEISVPAHRAEHVARALLAHEDVAPIGLGARDSLRLEAGLCLYGHDIDETTSPVEAALTWSIQKRRRAEGGFPGHERIARELAEGPSRLRVGIAPQERAPAREGTRILSETGEPIGEVTSGGFGPTYGGPVAMGYVAQPYAETGTGVQVEIRGTARPARVAGMPMVPHRYVRGKTRN